MPTTDYVDCDYCDPTAAFPVEQLSGHLSIEHGVSLAEIAAAPVVDLTGEPDPDDPEPPGTGTLTIHGDPNDRGFALKLGGVDLLDVDRDTYVTKVELLLGEGMARAYITYEFPLVDVSVPATVELGALTHNVMRKLGWTPPPPDIPIHEVVREQKGTCVLYVGPNTVCGKRPDDPIHGPDAPVGGE